MDSSAIRISVHPAHCKDPTIALSQSRGGPGKGPMVDREQCGLEYGALVGGVVNPELEDGIGA